MTISLDEFMRQFHECGRKMSRDAVAFVAEMLNYSPPVILRASRFWNDDRLSSIEKTKKAIIERDGKTCQYCGTQSDAWYMFVVEHVVPKPIGPFKPHNLVASCNSCNCIKGSQVWIPANLDAITKDHPDWKARILKDAHPAQFHCENPTPWQEWRWDRMKKNSFPSLR